MHKDLGLALEAAHEVRVPLPVTAAVAETYAAATASGLGSWDFGAVVVELARRVGVTGPGADRV